MKAKTILGLATGTLLGSLLLAGPALAGNPVMSLHPLHPGGEIVMAEEFEGQWVMASENVALLVTRDKNWLSGKLENSYTLEVTGVDGDEKLRFDVHLVRLRGTVFADIHQTSETGLFVIYPHVFAKFRVDLDELRFDFLDESYVSKALEEGRTDLAYEFAEGTLVLTAPSNELQGFLETYALDDEAFDESVSFTRLKEESDDSNS